MVDSFSSKTANKSSSDLTAEASGQEIPISTIKNKQLLPQHQNNKGETELHLAAIKNDHARIEQILKQHTDEDGDILIDVNIRDFAGMFALSLSLTHIVTHLPSSFLSPSQAGHPFTRPVSKVTLKRFEYWSQTVQTSTSFLKTEPLL